ncbi:MFS transporter [Streptomyces sp. ISL-100]|uniref:MFS transporter n=1 Tax=Streptomyces sp. ISL-100 TaxID=2819173 RepID=UPI001BE5089A|nr:MFS transporter [Streptomyces sp. ISL-100]MBT2396436.1 MFS transporter [Streptomyces sp. ISL-100]
MPFATKPPSETRPPETPEAAPESASFLRTVPALCAVGVLIVGQLYTVLPVLGLLADSWSTTAAAAGWTTTAFVVGYAAGFLFWGPLSDRLGRRNLMILGLLLTALTTAAVAAAPNLAVGCTIRVVQGLSAATFAPPAFAYIAERIEPARRVAAMTWLTSSFLAAGVLGQVYAQSVADAAGWRTVFVICAAAMIGGALLLRGVLAPDRTSAATSSLDAYRAMGRLLTKPSLVLLLLTTVTLLCGFVAVYTGLQVAGPANLAGDPDTMLLLRAGSLPAMVLVPLVTPFLVRLPAVHRVVTALLLAALVSAASALLSRGGDIDVVLLAALLFVFVFAIAVTAPALVEAIGAQAAGARGAAVALYTFALFIGASVGPLLATAAGDCSTVFAVIAGVLGTGAVLAALGHRVRR